MTKKSKRKNNRRILTKQRKAIRDRRRFKNYTLVQNTYIRRRAPKAKRVRSEGYPVYTGDQHIKRVILDVPERFSINNDIETLLSFIYKSKKVGENRRVTHIIFNFLKVVEIDDGAATILLSLCYDMNIKNVKVGINHLPIDKTAKSFIQQSGFIKYFSGPLIKDNVDGLNTTIKKGKSKILQKDSALLIHKAMKTIWGIEKRNQKLQGLFIELMTNSVNHAYLNNQRAKAWYISTSHYLEQNKVEFCFVDNGDGIINTINVKFRHRLLLSSEELLVRAFDGQFRSRTMLVNRGRGLIVVKKSQENMTIKGLKVISNNVLLDFENNIVKRLKTPFSGTFYSWIIDTSCK
ncbi:MAG: hypothetical protein ABI091_30330 [Ferruginibacter sp.]